MLLEIRSTSRNELRYFKEETHYVWVCLGVYQYRYLRQGDRWSDLCF